MDLKKEILTSLRMHLLSADHFQSSNYGWLLKYLLHLATEFDDWKWSTNKELTKINTYFTLLTVLVKALRS